MNPAQRILILLVRLYRVFLSPAKTFLFGPAAQCRFEPSCSQYAIQALKTHGALAGGWLAAKRVCRCHPWGKCGKDPVPPVGEFKVQSSKFKVVDSPPASAQKLRLGRQSTVHSPQFNREGQVHI